MLPRMKFYLLLLLLRCTILLATAALTPAVTREKGKPAFLLYLLDSRLLQTPLNPELPQILGGADLFLQGVLVPPGGLGEWLAGSARTVTVPGNPAPFAVGRMAVSKTEAAREGMKGRGLSVLHHYPGTPPLEGQN